VLAWGKKTIMDRSMFLEINQREQQWRQDILTLLHCGMMARWSLGEKIWMARQNVPPGLTDAVAIAAGTAHSLALRSNGTVIAWGYNNFGQTNIPPGLTGVAAIASGGNHCVALRSNGTVVAWGNNSVFQTNVPVGFGKRCCHRGGRGPIPWALKQDGTVTFFWGYQAFNPPDISPGLTAIAAIGCGMDHSLA